MTSKRTGELLTVIKTQGNELTVVDQYVILENGQLRDRRSGWLFTLTEIVDEIEASAIKRKNWIALMEKHMPTSPQLTEARGQEYHIVLGYPEELIINKKDQYAAGEWKVFDCNFAS